MIAIPLIDLLEVLIYWALRYAILALTIAAIGALGGLGAIGNFIASPLRKGLTAIVHYIEHEVATLALGVEAGVVNFVYGVAARIEHGAFSAYYTATKMAEALEILVGSEIPRYVHGALSGVGGIAHDAARLGRAVEAELAREAGRFGAANRALAHDIAHAYTAAEKAIRHAVAVTIPQALPWVDKRAGGAEAAAERALRGVKDLRNVLTGVVFAGLVAKALSRIGVSRNNCTNVHSFNKRVCGVDPRLLDTLFSGFLLLLGPFSLEAFAHEMQRITPGVLDTMRALIRETSSVGAGLDSEASRIAAWYDEPLQPAG